jgi:protein-disulfide isomerase
MRLIFAKKRTRKRRWVIAAAMVAGLAGLYWHIAHNAHELGTQPAIQHNGPPWVYGPADARFTVIEYADLECPFCKAHFSLMHQWIDQNSARSATHSTAPSVNWQWHHLPLAGHEPAASRSALVAECAGQVHGNDAFWKTAEWLYQQTRGNGQGVPAETPLPDADSLGECLQDKAMAQRLEKQIAQAHQLGITGTPTLVVKDNRTGKAMPIAGPASGDALLSAIDLLADDSPGVPPAP